MTNFDLFDKFNEEAASTLQIRNALQSKLQQQKCETVTKWIIRYFLLVKLSCFITKDNKKLAHTQKFGFNAIYINKNQYFLKLCQLFFNDFQLPKRFFLCFSVHTMVAELLFAFFCSLLFSIISCTAHYLSCMAHMLCWWYLILFYIFPPLFCFFLKLFSILRNQLVKNTKKIINLKISNKWFAICFFSGMFYGMFSTQLVRFNTIYTILSVLRLFNVVMFCFGLFHLLQRRFICFVVLFFRFSTIFLFPS